MYSGGVCVFSNHSMVASLRGSNTMRCATVASLYGKLLDAWLDVGTF